MAATTANVAWPIQANSPSIPSFRKSLVPKNDFNVYKSLITQDKGSYINRMGNIGPRGMSYSVIFQDSLEYF